MILRLLKIIGALFLLMVTFIFASFHAGVMRKPQNVRIEASARSAWTGKDQFGINQLVLEGSAFARGEAAGRLTKHLLLAQEKELGDQLAKWVSNRWILRGLVVAGINYFRGIEEFVPTWAAEEMYGVSLSAPKEYDFLADGFTRQLAYHGLHEVGQMMVDQGGDMMGCTVIAVPLQTSWVIARTFDFEGGEIFDREKILKWVFPTEGNAFVSVIWAGMVGVVSGVNERGLYISINAAGSNDFRRLGTPSTLVVLKALQFAKNIDEAIAILRDETVFITDIFAVVDRTSGRAFRVEKSPLRTEVTELNAPSIIANHLMSEKFQGDSINLWRKNELTSNFRYLRGTELLARLKPELSKSAKDAEHIVLRILRDKGEVDGETLHLNNRRAIDALIATHAVLYNAKDNVLFVSQSPGASGEFTGFDLTKSFARKTPVEIRRLRADPLVSSETFWSMRAGEKLANRIRSLVRKRNCVEAKNQLALMPRNAVETTLFKMATGDFESSCNHDPDNAKLAWKQALELHPAYPREIRELQEKLAQ